MKNLILALALLLTGSLASAASDGMVGAAGCGLGNMLMGSTGSQVFAATTNGTGMQTFGITTGTSNCGTGVFSSQMDVFVESNKVALSNDAARGQGETIAVLTNMMGCQDAKAVGATLKANYGQIFEANGTDARAISKSIQSTVAPTCSHNG